MAKRKTGRKPAASKSFKRGSTREKFLAALPATPAEMEKILGTKAKVHQTAFVLKREGVITKDNQGRYVLKGNGKTPQPQSGTSTAGTVRPRPAVPAAGADQVEVLLERAITSAQESMDEYIASVCDPNILGLLRGARDDARQRLEQYRAGKAA